jgi:hypothetical protein
MVKTPPANDHPAPLVTLVSETSITVAELPANAGAAPKRAARIMPSAAMVLYGCGFMENAGWEVVREGVERVN